MAPPFTRHAQTRMQQSGIARSAVDCLLEFGREHHDHHGAVVVMLDRPALRRVARSGAARGAALDGLRGTLCGRRVQRQRLHGRPPDTSPPEALSARFARLAAMDRTERFYRIDQLLKERGVVPRQTFLDELEISPATFKRDLEYMRDRFNAPVVWDADAGGYRYDKSQDGPRSRCRACGSTRPRPTRSSRWSTCCRRSTRAASSARTSRRCAHGSNGDPRRRRSPADEVRKRIRLLAFAPRKLPLAHFETIGPATLKRRRLQIDVLRAQHRRTSRSATCRRSGSSTTARTGTSTRGATCATTCAASRSTASAASSCSTTPAAKCQARGARGAPRDRLRHRARRRRQVGEAPLLGRARAMGALGSLASRTEGKLRCRRALLLELPYRDDRELLLES